MLLLPVALASLSAACSGDGEPVAVSVDIGPDPIALTSLPASPTSASPAAAPAPDASAPPPTTIDEVASTVPSVPQYEVVSREPGSDGDTLIVLLDAGSYTSLSDIDLQNVIADVYDRFAPVFEAHVVDDPEAAVIASRDGPAAVALSTFADHYLVRLEDGFRIVFLGRFEDAGTTTLGS